MPNYKSKMLTFLSVSEMISMALDSTDEDGLLFAVATDATNFKVVMWRKNSTATVDNETVYPANGLGRWHVLTGGNINSLSDVNISNLTTGQALVYNGNNWVNQTISTGGSSVPELLIYDDTLGSVSPPDGSKMAVVNKTNGDELYVAKNNTWELLDISAGDTTIAFSDLPIGTTSNTVAVGNHSHTLDNLSDVIITSPANGDIVSFDGTNWINQTPVAPATNLDGLSDVVITSPANGQALSFNGTNWINANVSSGGGGDPVLYVSGGDPIPSPPPAGKSIMIQYKQEWGGTTGSAFDSILNRQITYTWVDNTWKVHSASNITQVEFASGYGDRVSVASVAVGQFVDIDFEMFGEYDPETDSNPIIPTKFQGDVPGQMLFLLRRYSVFEIFVYMPQSSYVNNNLPYNSANHGGGKFWKRIS